MTGRPLTQWQGQTTDRFSPEEKVRLIGLTGDRRVLYQRIEHRIDGWLKEGWLKEAKKLATRPLSRTAKEAVGYRELFDFLDGHNDWETCHHLIQRNTCRYAKRQSTWFRADPRIDWIETDGKTAEEIAGEIIKSLWNGRYSSRSD